MTRTSRKREKRSRQGRFFLLFGGLLTSLFILIISMAGSKEFTAPHKFGLEIIGPLQTAVTKVTNYTGSIWKNYIALVHVRQENEQLRMELQQYKAANIEYREARATNMRLQKLLELKESPIRFQAHLECHI